jgi:hypothetical protein
MLPLETLILFLLPLKQYQLRGVRVLKNPLEMHCIINLVLGLDDLLEREVVMSVSECVEINVSVVFPTIC